MRWELSTLIVIVLVLGISGGYVFGKDSSRDSTFRARIALQMNLQFTYYNDDHSTYSPAQGLNLTILDNNLGFTFQPAVRLSTRSGNAMDFGFEEMYFNIRENARFEIYDSIKGTTIVTGQEITTMSIWLRYEYDYIFMKKTENRVKPFLGISFGLFYKYAGNKPAPTYLFDTSSWSLGTTARVVPGGLINLDNGYFTMSLPINLGTIALKQSKTDNPFLPEKTRKTTTWDYDYWTLFRMRFSYGIYIR